jgi:hypothetical protein
MEIMKNLVAQAAYGQVLVTLLPDRYRPLVIHALKYKNNALILFYSLYCFVIFCSMKHVLDGKVIVNDDSLPKLYTDRSLNISADANEIETLHTDVATTSSVTVYVFRNVYSQQNV